MALLGLSMGGYTTTSPNVANLAITTVVGGTVVAVTGLFGYHCYLSRRRSKEPPIRWSWLPLLGHALEIGNRPLELLTDCAKKYGEIFGLVVAGNRMFIITDPHSHNLILNRNKDLSWEEFHSTVMTEFFGASKATMSKHVLNDDLMRSWFSKYIFSDSSLQNLTTRMQTSLKEMIKRIPEGEVSMYDFLGKFVFDAAIASLFNDAAGNDPSLYPAFSSFDNFLPMAVAGIGVDNVKNAREARAVLASAVKTYTDDNCELIQKRWEHFNGLLSEGKVTPKDPISFQLAMLWASAGNTVPSTFWTFYYILQTPAVLKQVLQEICESTGKTSIEQVDGLMSQEQLNKMALLDACITETLRLTSGSMIMRVVQRPCELTLDSGNTYKFRKGDRVGICPPITHRDPEVFPEPLTFKPHRWLVGDTAEDRAINATGKLPLRKNGKALPATLAFLPFGGGPTYCPGRRFARNEIKTLVAVLLSKFDMSVVKGYSTTSTSTTGTKNTDTSVFFEEEAQGPGFNGARAGLGIFPPKREVLINIKRR